MGNLILIIDDSITVCKIIETCLHREGYEVCGFSDGEAAMRWLASREACIPDLVFVDLGLPQMDGYSVIRLLRAQPSFRQIPIVIISRRDGLIDKLKGRLVGASDYVVKPFKVDHLISIVQSHLGVSAKAGLVPV